ncbi:MAG: phosphotransferase family protein [Acidimicrobiia bacterium]
MSPSPLDSIDVAQLTAWLDQAAPHLGSGPVTLSVISGGSTNVVLGVERHGRTTVFRSPPLVAATPQGAKTIEREATILAALDGTTVPHPGFHAYCADPSVIGVPFYVMDKVDGWSATITEDDVTLYVPGWEGGADQHYLGYAMVDGMIAMANLDYEAAGLGGFGKPDGFLERQTDRWLGQLDTYPKRYSKYEPRDLEGLDYVADYLRSNVPDTWRPGLMHGDYALNNVMFHNRPPSRLVAIIDWETATIGDPLLDLAGFTQSLRSDRPGSGRKSYFDSVNFPHQNDALAYYAEGTGRDLSHIDYYYVLCKFRMACMIEYKVAEAIQGLSPKAKGDRFDRRVRALLIDARDLAQAAN